MLASLTIVVLPRGEFSTYALEATLASVQNSTDEPVTVVGVATSGANSSAHHAGFEAAGVRIVEPSTVLAASEVLAFVSPGDRLRSGALEARFRPLTAHPSAVLAVAGHVLVDPFGREILEVKAPSLPVDPIDLLLHPTLELAAVLVRSAALDLAAFELLTRPHGDAVVWSRLVRAGAVVRSGEIAADVPIDVDRHGHSPAARAAELLNYMTLCPPNDAGAVELRRELLRRLYLEPDPGLGEIDLTELLGAAATHESAAAVVADLAWALERQRDALTAERIRWPAGEVEPDDELGAMYNEQLPELQALVATVGAEISVRDNKIRRLESEIYRRDAIIALLRQSPLGAFGSEAR